MCYCPTPTLHLNLALTGDCAFQLSPKKPHSVWFISVLKSGDMGQCPEKSPSPCNTCVIIQIYVLICHKQTVKSLELSFVFILYKKPLMLKAAFDKIYSKNCNIVKYYNLEYYFFHFNTKKKKILWWQSWIFSSRTLVYMMLKSYQDSLPVVHV